MGGGRGWRRLVRCGFAENTCDVEFVRVLIRHDETVYTFSADLSFFMHQIDTEMINIL